VGDPKELATFIRNGDWNEYHLIIRSGTQVHILNGHVMSGGWGAPLERLKPYLTNKDTSNLRFSLANSLKDLSYYNQMAEDMKVDHTVAQAVKNSLAQACNETDPQTLLPEIVSIIAKRH
jgi:3-hydroxyisobutyrate dehydrogenase-like beta-hydroxyacid dehydrogenase